MNKQIRCVDENGSIIMVGDEVLDFRGDKWIYTGCYQMPAPSTGRVIVREPGSERAEVYYPSVINAKLI